jgi:hypothetical protein
LALLIHLDYIRRFGFPNRQALEEGKTGTDCRGQESEVVVVWSITSGKRQILMDGKEIHYASSRTSVIDHSWSTRGNHVLKVVCHAAAPMSPTPGFRQYDMFIDGQSFFTMPKVYELGIRGVADRAPVVPYGQSDQAFAYGGGGGGGYDGGGGGGGYGPPPARLAGPRSPEEEEEELQRAIQASLRESKAHLSERGGPEPGPAPAAPEADLLDFAGSSEPALPPPAPAPVYGGASYDSSSFASGTQSYPALTDGSAYGAPRPPPSQPAAYGGGYGAPVPGPYAALPPSQPMPPQQPAVSGYDAPPPAAPYGAAPPAYGAPPGVDAFNSSGTGQFFATSDDPFAPKPPEPPSHRDIAGEILSAYGGPPAGAASMPPAPGGYYPPPQAPQYPGSMASPSYGTSNGFGSAGAPSLALENGDGPGASLTMSGLAETEEKPLDPFEAALKKLVNVDHIDEPAEEVLKLTMKKKEEETNKKKQGKSQPKPPVAAKIVGSQATLAQIKSVKPATEGPKEGVMKPPPQLWHPDANMAGAMVVHGTHPPPLQQPGFVGQGFGAGYNPYAYQQQYQQHYQQQQPPPQQQQQQYRYR